MKQNKVNPKNTAEESLNKRVEVSRKLLHRLSKLEPPPSYAKSILEAAIHNKTRVIEAHLTTLSEDERNQ